jgi:hypothetical protein
MSEDEPTDDAVEEPGAAAEPVSAGELRVDGYDVVSDVKVRLNPVLLEPTTPTSSHQLSTGRRGRFR